METRHADGAVWTPGRGTSQRATQEDRRRIGEPDRRSAAGAEVATGKEGIAARVARRVGRDGFERYFDGKASLSFGERGLEVAVPSRFMAELLQRRFGPMLREAARDHAGGDAGVSFRVEEPATGAGAPRPATAGDGPPGRPPAGRSPAGSAPGGRSGRRQAWASLEDFVVGESNRMAYQGALRVAEGEAGAGERPLTRLFIHGRCGLGKTHLLQGIARRYKEKRRGSIVRYTTGEAFTNEFIASVRAGPGKCDQFRRSYRGVDLLCVDDVHFLANKQATQGELLHTFDAIDLSGARVVLASDEHPRQVRSFSEALVSRFMAGGVSKLDHPERELRERIVRAIAGRRGLAIDDAAVRLVADAAGAACSVRDLEGMVTRIEAVWRLTPAEQPGADIGVLGVQRALGRGGAGGAPMRRPVRVEQIVAGVCRALDVEVGEFTGRGRHKRVVLARAATAYLSRKMTTSSFPEIARAMGRPNHSTIVTAYQRICAQIEAKQGAGLEGEMAGLSIGDVCERLGADLAGSA